MNLYIDDVEILENGEEELEHPILKKLRCVAKGSNPVPKIRFFRGEKDNAEDITPLLKDPRMSYVIHKTGSKLSKALQMLEVEAVYEGSFLVDSHSSGQRIHCHAHVQDQDPMETRGLTYNFQGCEFPLFQFYTIAGIFSVFWRGFRSCRVDSGFCSRRK